MREKLKNEYFYWGLTLFISIGAAILLYFLCLRIDKIMNVFVKLFTILLPIFLGMLFAYLLNPLVKFFEDKISIYVTEKVFKDNLEHNKFNRVMSILVTYLILGLILFIFVSFIIPNLLESLQTMITNIPTYINNIYDRLKDIVKNNPALSINIDNINTHITNYVTNLMIPSVDTIMVSITSSITSVIKALVNIIIGIIVSVYLLYDKESFIKSSKKVMKSIMSKKVYTDTMAVLEYTNKIFGGFMMAKIIDSLIIGILTFIVISIFNIPYALIISLIVGITNIIPYFGPFIGAIPCAVLLLLIDPTKCLTFVIIIFIIQQFDGNILGPKLIGNKTGIKSFWVLFSILLFGGLFGFVGMIFGVPIFAVIYSLIVKLINDRLKKKNLLVN